MSSPEHQPVSVIIPTYNRVGTVTRAVDSVLSQTHKNYEIVVVDDGSKDDTRKVLEERYSDRIRYIYQPNAGAAAARNAGIRASRHELVAFLDSDDTWLPEKLEVQTALMSDANIVLSYTNLINRRDGIDDEYFTDIGMHFDTEPVVLAQPLRTMLRSEGCGIWTSVVMCRKTAIAHVGYFDERMRIYEDVRLWLKLAFEGKWAVTSKPLAIRTWSQPGGQLVDLKSQPFYKESAYMRLEIFMEAYAHGLKEPPEVQRGLRKVIAAALVGQAKFFALDGEHNRVRRRALEFLMFGVRGINRLKALIGLGSPRLLGVLARQSWRWQL